MRGLSIAALLLWLAACAEHERIEPSSYPSTGLYTPGSTLGASDPTDVPMTVSNRCVPLPFGAPADGGVLGTSGTLTIAYQTQTYGGYYAPKNCTAVWIETMEGAYVATLELYATLRRPGLVYWQERACTEMLGPDAITKATLRTHDTMHEVTWNGVDFEGKSVPDGTYKLHIEVTETDLQPGELAVFDIIKGPTPYSMPLPLPVEGPFAQATASWTVQ